MDDINIEHEIGLDSDELDRAMDEVGTAVAPAAEADHSFYTRVLDSCKKSMDTIDKQLEDINSQAQRLLDSKRKLIADRQRLATQRHAARISLRFLEDAEAKRQSSGG